MLLAAIAIAGYTWEEADKLRKAMGKKIPKEMARQKEKFISGCINGGLPEAKAIALWLLIEPFAAYGFNKAHAASYGMVFHGTAIAYLEHACRFLKPVRAGDTLTTVWEVPGLEPKPKHDGGIVAMKATCSNQDGEVVAEATGTMLVRNAE